MHFLIYKVKYCFETVARKMFVNIVTWLHFTQAAATLPRSLEPPVMIFYVRDVS